MDGVVVGPIVVLLGLVLLDVLALRYGADSRSRGVDRADWWTTDDRGGAARGGARLGGVAAARPAVGLRPVGPNGRGSGFGGDEVAAAGGSPVVAVGGR